MSEPKFKPGDRVRITDPDFGGVVTRVISWSKATAYVVEPVVCRKFPADEFRQFAEVFLELDTLGEMAAI